jgi:acyl-CoA thioesterase
MSLARSDLDAVARATAQTMWDKDFASRSLGMSLDAVGPGEARLSMTITAAMTNGHKTCHGGYIFILADSAFAYACNSYNQNTVAQHCSVTFLNPAVEGDRLTAVAREVSRIGRGGVYDVRVTNQNGEHVAEFRGHSRTIKGTPIAESA